MTSALSPFDRAVAELVALGKTREAAEQLVRTQLPHLAPARVEDPGPDALEDDVVDAVDKLMRALGFDIVRLSQKRASKVTPGVPDRYYLHRRRRLALWWEAKAAWGRQSPEQRAFQEMCDEAGQHYVLGGLACMQHWLITTGVVEGFDGNGAPHPTPLPQ